MWNLKESAINLGVENTGSIASYNPELLPRRHKYLPRWVESRRKVAETLLRERILPNPSFEGCLLTCSGKHSDKCISQHKEMIVHLTFGTNSVETIGKPHFLS